MMAAGTAGENGCDVVLLERNQKCGRKLMITGKGRCNVSNNCKTVQDLIDNVPRNGRFLYGAFSKFMPADVMDFFENRGVPLKTERGRRVFPVSDKAADIVDSLSSYAADNSNFVNARVKELIIDNGAVRGVVTYDGEQFFADRVIVAAGGFSYPATGSDGDGFALARQAGHTLYGPQASLVPLEIHEGFCSRLSGLSLRNIAIKVIDTASGKTIYEDFGELLFTHFGVSGPVILSASAHLKNPEKGRYRISVDLKPALSHEMLDARILRDFSENLNRNFINSLNSLLPKSLVPVIVSLSGIPMNLKVNQVTKEQRVGLVSLLKDFSVTVTRTRPVEEAVITMG